MIGHLEKTVIDCSDPRALAAFYCAVLGMQINQDLHEWVVIGRSPDRRDLAFQLVPDYSPPTWPEPGHPQQMHLDIRIEDPDRALPVDDGAATSLACDALSSIRSHTRSRSNLGPARSEVVSAVRRDPSCDGRRR